MILTLEPGLNSGEATKLKYSPFGHFRHFYLTDHVKPMSLSFFSLTLDTTKSMKQTIVTLKVMRYWLYYDIL